MSISKADSDQAPLAGRIIKILQDSASKRSLVILDTFQVAATRHKTFGMPVLLRRFNEKSLIIVPATASQTNLHFLPQSYILLSSFSEHFV